MVDIVEGDAFIYNGAGMEGFADAIKEITEEERVLSIEVSENLELIESHEEEHSEESEIRGRDDEQDIDPHIWLDPVLARQAAEKIKDELTQLRPGEKDFFEENFKELETELDSLHNTFKEMAFEANNDTFLVSHAGYGYWEERYGLKQIGVSGISPSEEPSQKELQNIIALAEENGLEYIMFEQNIPSKVTEVVRDEVGANTLYLHNLESLSEQELNSGEDYFSLMNKNIENLSKALNNVES